VVVSNMSSMPKVNERGRAGARTASDRRGALRDLAVGFAFASLAVVGTWWLLGLAASYILVATGVYAALAILVLRALPGDLRGPGLGPANRVTLARAALAVPIFAVALHPGSLGAAVAWWTIVVSTAVMVADGFDGYVARRTGSGSRFGARFDMELDAALLLALSVLVWRQGRVGYWVLSIGLMRYAFVGASWIWPELAADLPPSQRRKIVCVIQGVALLVALGPVVPDAIAVAVAAAGLLALAYSFGVDVRWALAAGRGAGRRTVSGV
jgi:phosphatidylglycerophosphate synthase